MNRNLYYLTQQLTDTALLTSDRDKMIALGYLAQGVLGTSTIVDGLPCVPTAPASMAVQIGAGAVYSQAPVDTVSYGSLGVDTVDQIIKQGIILGNTQLTLTPPVTSGQAINYLIQAALSETDTGLTTLSYFNSANPTVPFSGPAGSGTQQPVLRQCSVVLQAKAGVGAVAGSQVTPSPDSGYVGLYVVTVANGATTIVSANIVTYASAPFVAVKLPQIPAWVQAGSSNWGVDTGSVNAVAVTLVPAPTVIGAGFFIRFRKIATASTGAMTIAVNGTAPVALIYADGTPMSATQIIPANFLAEVVFDGTSWRFVNGLTSSGVGSVTASSGEGINVGAPAIVGLNYPGLASQPAIANTDLFSFYSQGDVHHRATTYQNLLASVASGIPASLLNVQVITASGTYTKTAGTRSALVFVTGGGGGGGSSSSQNCSGGGAGGTAIAFLPLTGVSTVSVVVGAGGTTGANQPGGNGGVSSFSTYAAANGGTGGIAGYDAPDNAGHGGAATAGLLLLAGCPGEHCALNTVGNGGPSFWGGAGLGINNNPSYAFQNSLPGTLGGGGGGADTTVGGAGGNGVIVVFEFA